MKIRKIYYLIIILVVTFVANINFILAQKKSEYVNLFIGTAGDNGQVDPAACVPYGMVRICPDSDPRTHVGYDYDVTKISGFSINRISGIGCSGAGGNLSVRPALKKETLNINKKTETATPGYYSVVLDNGVKTEFTATNNVAFERFYYLSDKEANLTLNVGASFTKVLDAKYEIISDTEIEGYIHAGNTCDHGAFKLYFYLTTNKTFSSVSTSEYDTELLFKNTDGKPVELRIAISPIDIATAKEENAIAGKLTFDKAKKQAADKWEDMLSRVDVKGGSKEDKTLFYTSIYRTFLSPANTTSWDNKFLGTDGTI